MTDKVCPWNINFDNTDVYFYDKKQPNPWNPIGNGWRLDTGFYVECYDSDTYPPFACGCNVFNITCDGCRISEYHPQKLGIIVLSSSLGFECNLITHFSKGLLRCIAASYFEVMM